MIRENIKEHNVTWNIRKFKDKSQYLMNVPYFIGQVKGNLALNEGVNELWTLVCGSGATKFDHANAYLGVGDSDVAVDKTQTGLQATTNKMYKSMDDDYPTYGEDCRACWLSTFDAGEATFDWKEFTVANGNGDSYKNLCRRVFDWGTKGADEIWELALEIALISV